MKNDFLSFFDQLPAVLKYAVNGLVGGFVWALYKKLKFWAALRQIVIGAILSAYSTPFIASKTSLSTAGFTSFVIGIIGMSLIEILYKWAVGKLKILFDNNE
jgi:hypothetical protein